MKNRLLACAGIATLAFLAEGLWVYAFLPHPADASRNSSGSYTLYSPGNPAVTNQLISTSLWNNTFGDIATELSDSLSRTGKGGMTAPLRTADGVVGTPSWSWTSETGTGYYRIGAGDLGLSILGTKTGEWTANGLRVANGAVATPSLSFFNDTGGGLYRIGSNDFGFAVNGVKTQEWTATGSTIVGTFGVSGATTLSSGGTTLVENGTTLSGFASFWAGTAAASPTTSNFFLAADGSSNTSINSPTTLNLDIAGTAVASLTSSGLKVGTTNVSTVAGFTRGGCTLNGASPAVCTASVVSGQTCTAAFAGTTAPPNSGLRTNNAAGTLSVYGANGSTEGVSYTCF